MRTTLIGMSSALVLIAAPAFAQTATETPATEAPLVEAQPESPAIDGPGIDDSELSAVGEDESVVGVQPPPPVERAVECTGNEIDCPMGDQAPGTAAGVGGNAGLGGGSGDTGDGDGAAQ